MMNIVVLICNIFFIMGEVCSLEKSQGPGDDTINRYDTFILVTTLY